MKKDTKKISTQDSGKTKRSKKTQVTLRGRARDLLSRRPHRSFRRTRRRDYTRSLKLPGYWAFTTHVWQKLWRHKRLFGMMALLYALLTLTLVGMASQSTYLQLSEQLRSTSAEVFKGDLSAMGEAGLLLVAGVAGGFRSAPTETQQIYAVILFLFAWLTTVWLLRAILAGRTPRLRDGLYNAGAPVLSTLVVGLVLAVQLLPLALAVLAYGTASATGLLGSGGVEVMLFWVVFALLGGLSLYWITSTLIALVVVTLPGMYPWQAIRTAGDLVIGRRLRILWRLLWMLLSVAVVCVLVMVPVILLDTWLKGVFPAIEWLPLVPIVLLIVGTLSAIWAASYVYLLYRRIVDDDASPA